MAAAGFPSFASALARLTGLVTAYCGRDKMLKSGNPVFDIVLLAAGCASKLRAIVPSSREAAPHSYVVRDRPPLPIRLMTYLVSSGPFQDYLERSLTAAASRCFSIV